MSDEAGYEPPGELPGIGTDKIHQRLPEMVDDAWQQRDTALLLRTNSVARFVASKFREQEPNNAYSAFADTHELPPTTRATKQEIVSLILRNVPMPQSDTGWERLVEFHEGSERAYKRAQLRHWITQVAKQDLDLREAAEEIERFTLAYKRQLDKNKIESRWSTLEFIIVMPLRLVEGLVPYKFSGPVKEFFEWRTRERALLEVESSVRGEELAYLLEVEHFLSS